MNLAQSTLTPEGLVYKWNKTFPIGTLVRYWTGRRDGIGKESKTTSEAQVLGGHTAVVWVEGYAGCVALSHVEPL
jgi:hypothetical protein